MDNLDFNDLCLDDLCCGDLDYELKDVPNVMESIDSILVDNRPFDLSPIPTINQTLYSEKISIRIPKWILAAIKAKAVSKGMPYQTFINLILSGAVSQTFNDADRSG